MNPEPARYARAAPFPEVPRSEPPLPDSPNRNLRRLYPVECLRPFLFRVVRNLCYDELRRRGRFSFVSLDEAAGDTESPLLAIPDSRARKRLVRMLRPDTLAALAASQLLAYLMGQTGVSSAGVDLAGGGDGSGNHNIIYSTGTHITVEFNSVNGVTPEAMGKLAELAGEAVQAGERIEAQKAEAKPS